MKWKKKTFKKPFKFKSFVTSKTELILEDVKRRALE